MVNKAKVIKLLLAVGLALAVLLCPREALPIENLTVLQQRVMAFFVLAIVLWVTEPIPIFSTSVLIIFLELILLSDKSLKCFLPAVKPAEFGDPLPYQEIMATFASPIILLFLGGYFLAMAATKYRLDHNLARVLLRPFGTNPKFVMLGLMVVTALFSMFMSNTATTAMMLAILTPVLAGLDRDDPGCRAFVLAVPFAANVGGMGTPIGTPPNAVALKYLTDDIRISFGEWMFFGVPFVIILLLITWLLLLAFYRPRAATLQIELQGRFQKNWKAITVYITFAATVILWLTTKWHGLNSYIVALAPVTVFSVTGIITPADLKKISWEVLWLVSGGIALGMAMEKTGLSEQIIASIPFANFPSLLIVLAATVLTLLMANFMSHTATANLLLPIVAALGVNLPAIRELGGPRMIILAVAFSSSLGMGLPISTPPNAMAHATGLIESRHMFKPGLLVGAIGLGMIYLMLTLMKQFGYFG